MPACNVLNFDKTTTLTNYPVKLCRSAKSQVTSIYERFTKIIWDHLKVKKQIFEVSEDSLGIIIMKGVVNGTRGQISKGKYDMLMLDDYQRETWRNILNTFIMSGMCYVTKKKAKLAVFELMGTLSARLWFSILVFIFIIAIVLTLMMRQSFLENVINIIRAMVGTSMLYEPQLSHRRIIFIWIILTFMRVNYYLQSNLSAIVAKVDKDILHIESYESLIEQKYTIYSSEYFREFFHNSDFGKYIKRVDNVSECLNLMENNRIICIDDCVEMKFNVRESDTYHISQDITFNRYNTLLFRDDFPLQTRFINQYKRLFESGIVAKFQIQQSWAFLGENKSVQPVLEEEPLLKSKFPIYLLLLYLYTFVIFVFIMELIVFHVNRKFKIFVIKRRLSIL